MTQYKAKHKLSDHKYIVEVEIDGKMYLVVVTENEDGEPERWAIFGEMEK